ncbi:MAG: NAD(P)/FAD-dependent oxidoreductase [Methanomassiliicoccales archaeon]
MIIGAGPAGLTAGIYSRSRKLETLIVDAGEVGGQLTGLYPDKGVGNYPGCVLTQAKKLADRMVAHAQQMGCEIIENEKALDIEDREGHLVVRAQNNEYEAKAVIIAIGIGLFKPRKLGVPGEEEFENKGVSYKVPDKDYLVDKKVLFVGGGNSALDMALIANEVADTYVAHRRNEFRADESVVEQVMESDITTITKAEVEEIKGGDWVESVVLKQGKEGEPKEMDFDHVVINIGFTPEIEELEHWDVDLDGTQILVSPDMRTSRRGVFACGDVVSYPGKYKQIVTGCGEGATAANSAYKFIKDPYWA